MSVYHNREGFGFHLNSNHTQSMIQPLKGIWEHTHKGRSKQSMPHSKIAIRFPFSVTVAKFSPYVLL